MNNGQCKHKFSFKTLNINSKSFSTNSNFTKQFWKGHSPPLACEIELILAGLGQQRQFIQREINTNFSKNLFFDEDYLYLNGLLGITQSYSILKRTFNSTSMGNRAHTNRSWITVLIRSK